MGSQSAVVAAARRPRPAALMLAKSMTRFRPPRIERRREFLAAGVAGLLRGASRENLKPVIVNVQVLFDRGAHSGSGLREDEIAIFRRYQDRARTEYAVSGIVFDLKVREGAYLRTQGYSEIPDRFLSRNAINLFGTAQEDARLVLARADPGCRPTPSTRLFWALPMPARRRSSTSMRIISLWT